jgi:hypothetical protein
MKVIKSKFTITFSKDEIDKIYNGLYLLLHAKYDICLEDGVPFNKFVADNIDLINLSKDLEKISSNKTMIDSILSFASSKLSNS